MQNHSVRRVTTGHASDASSIIESDDVVHGVDFGGETYSARIWSTLTSPADNTDSRDGAGLIDTLTAPGGTACYVVDWPPRGVFPLHRTHSIDFLAVLSGELELELDSGERTTLRTGDTVVQRGTNHLWRNPSDKWCRCFTILVEAAPLTVDGVALGATIA